MPISSRLVKGKGKDSIDQIDRIASVHQEAEGIEPILSNGFRKADQDFRLFDARYKLDQGSNWLNTNIHLREATSIIEYFALVLLSLAQENFAYRLLQKSQVLSSSISRNGVTVIENLNSMWPINGRGSERPENESIYRCLEIKYLHF